MSIWIPRKSLLIAICFIALCFILTSCQLTKHGDGEREQHVYQMSPQAYSYLTKGLDFIEVQALALDATRWPQVREAAYQQALGATEFSDTHDALKMAVASLDDGHSYFHPVDQVEVQAQSGSQPSAKILTADLTLLAIPTHLYQERLFSVDYIRSVHRVISQRRHSCGWVVDLRNNRGGDQEPMIIALSPLLPRSLNSYQWSPDQESRTLFDRSHASSGRFRVLLQESDRLPTALRTKPVAVLVNRNTGSSGEATLLQFLGREDTQIFGEPTAGATTNILHHQLVDGSRLGVAISYFVDRTGVVHRNGIEPDLYTNDEDALDYAVKWLYQEYGCSVDDEVALIGK